MGNQINTIDSRIKFVKGQVTTGEPDSGLVACGPGTLYPLLVTLPQLAEIMYRVRDSWFTGGSVTFSGSQPHRFFGDPNPDRLVNYNEQTSDDFGEAYGESTRGYYSTFLEPPEFENLFTEAYDLNGIDFYDAKDERVLWVPDEKFGGDGTPPGSISFPEDVARGFRCGFSNHAVFYGNLSVPPNFYTFASAYPGGEDVEVDPPYYSQAAVQLEFSGKVAFAAADDPFHPDAKLYVGLYFRADGGDSLVNIRSLLYRIPDSEYNGVVTPLSLKLELSNEQTVSCPLYHSGYYEIGGTDFVITAKKWWPFAHPNGSPFWNRFDGTLLPSQTPTKYSPILT